MTRTGGSGGLSRRAAVAGLAIGLAVPLAPLLGTALAAPLARRAAAAEAEALTAILGRSRLAADSGFALADLATGRLIEGHRADTDRTPASVAKILTALYALDTLGPDHRFRTELRLDGPVSGGLLEGDLALVGGGDPALDTDAFGDLAGRLAAAGIARVGGRFRLGHGALPELAEIEPGQPAQAGYNPAVSGVNLNFNRVWLAWRPGADGPQLELTAPGARHATPVRAVRAEIGPGPPLGHRIEGDAEVWRMSPAAARGEGGVWLPVRRPPPYAGDVFAALAARAGVELPAPQPEGTEPPGRTLAVHDSPPLDALLRGMLFHSTNLTAEVAGLAAAQTSGRAESLAASAAAMTAWAKARFGLVRAQVVNHSGLTVRSRLTPRETVRVLVRAERDGLADMLRERPILDARGDVATGLGARVVAKTGTLWFARGLAGYLEGGGRRLAFAIFADDLAARGPAGHEPAEAPPGAAAWVARARGQEQALLRRWAELYL